MNFYVLVLKSNAEKFIEKVNFAIDSINMKFTFQKYHGAGNDFILFDNRQRHFPQDQKLIEKLCHRRYGIGADGLILVENHPDFEFGMQYFNSDGRIGSMCGNGGRCAVIFAKEMRFFTESTANFMAVDGPHGATITGDNQVKISMNPVSKIEMNGSNYILNTGSPHLVKFTTGLNEMDVVEAGRKVRYSDSYREKGINVNFATIAANFISMRTYERGVEAETLSCGTGTVAVAIAVSLELKNQDAAQTYDITTLGGKLKVFFTKESAQQFDNIYLEGPVEKVYTGVYEIAP